MNPPLIFPLLTSIPTAIRNVTGHFYLNGNWRIDFPRELPFASTIFHYERKPHSFFAPESIRALGPISEAIYIVVLYQEANPGIDYEYSIPKGLVSSESDEYLWRAEGFGASSAECGGGRRERRITCVGRSDYREVGSYLCDGTRRPSGVEVCNEGPCPMRLVLGGIYYGEYIQWGDF